MLERIHFPQYKCFDKGISIQPPKLVNLIIGKNNSGKSSFLNYISALYTYSKHKTIKNNIILDVIIDETDLPFFDIYRIDPRFFNSYQISEKQDVINERISIEMVLDGINERLKICQKTSDSLRKKLLSVQIKDEKGLLNHLLGHRAVSSFKVAAERDIQPEEKRKFAMPTEKGEGIVNAILYHSIHKNGKRIIVNNLLKDINEMLIGECSFTNLLPLEREDIYELTLSNSNNNEIPLSEMGSGLKTIIFTFFILENFLANQDDQILFFEELENNLHPEIQRRIFDRIYNFAIENKCRVFITSHSNVAINALFEKEETMIYHIEKENETTSSVSEVSTTLGKKEILDDLGVKASDIFQSNGIIWVEGPSDRIYINKWLSLVDPSLKENIDYTFLYYGGRLLSHYSAGENIPPEVIDILLTNRNSAIVMDSDIKQDGDTINPTKQRISDEFAANKSFYWVTKGREIENYIHKDAINALYQKNNKEQIGLYEDFKDYINEEEPCFEGKKVKFAKGLSFKESDLDVLDLKEKITNLAETIQKWNK